MGGRGQTAAHKAANGGPGMLMGVQGYSIMSRAFSILHLTLKKIQFYFFLKKEKLSI